MREIQLKKAVHLWARNDEVEDMQPTFDGDAILTEDGKPVGLYLAKIPDRLQKLANVANAELRSKRVPKSMMGRVQLVGEGDRKESVRLLQYSTIIGSIAAKPHMRRPYPTKSSVHRVKTARPFVKSMVLAGRESLKIMQAVCPELYEQHRAAVEGACHPDWRFADHFTSSISNVNISANIHRDNLNIQGALNVIITKRENATGGHLFVPDYNLVTPAGDNSMLVYPAWRNMHGVTPIKATHPGGYRNSLIWYALKGFNGPDATRAS